MKIQVIFTGDYPNGNVTSERVHYLCKGMVENGADLAFCCHQLGIEKQTVFLGSMPPEKVIQEMKSADIFLLAAVEEGFGNAVIEAQAM